MNGHSCHELLDPDDDQPEDYISQLAHDADLLAADPEFAKFLERLDKEMDEERAGCKTCGGRVRCDPSCPDQEPF